MKALLSALALAALVLVAAKPSWGSVAQLPATPPERTVTVCLPAGASPDFLKWDAAEIMDVPVYTSGGKTAFVKFSLYEKDERMILAGWYQGQLAYYDPAPGGQVPALLNVGVFDEGGSVRDQVLGGCAWRKATPVRKRDEPRGELKPMDS